MGPCTRVIMGRPALKPPIFNLAKTLVHDRHLWRAGVGAAGYFNPRASGPWSSFAGTLASQRFP